jgi:hypothetical protein
LYQRRSMEPETDEQLQEARIDTRIEEPRGGGDGGWMGGCKDVSIEFSSSRP